MKIFEKFYNGLAEKYQESSKRCKIIITKCLYFSDITPMNIFIVIKISNETNFCVKVIMYKKL
jgi:hypothetical protein